ncbi:MAG: hypothetical protein ABI988_18765 [Nitrospirota bacterium]
MPESLPQRVALLVKLHGKGPRHLELAQETLTIGLKVDNIPSRSKILPSRGIMHGL